MPRNVWDNVCTTWLAAIPCEQTITRDRFSPPLRNYFHLLSFLKLDPPSQVFTSEQQLSNCKYEPSLQLTQPAQIISDNIVPRAVSVSQNRVTSRETPWRNEGEADRIPILYRVIARKGMQIVGSPRNYSHYECCCEYYRERERERDKCSCKNGAFFFIRSIETDIRSRSSRKEERKGEERRKIGRRRPCDNKNFDVK